MSKAISIDRKKIPSQNPTAIHNKTVHKRELLTLLKDTYVKSTASITFNGETLPTYIAFKIGNKA